MMINLRTTLAAAVWVTFLGGVEASAAELPVSRQVGMLPITVKGNATTFLGVPFSREPVASGTVTSHGGSQMTDSGASFPVGAFNQNAAGQATHYLQITGGASRGRVLPVVSNTATQITIAGAVGSLENNVDEYLVIPFWTLNTLFGAANQAGFGGGSSAGNSDNISFVNTSGVLADYFYKASGVGGTGWKLATAPTGPNQGETPVSAFGGFVVRRRAAEDVVIPVSGTVFSGRQQVPIAAGTSVISWPESRIATSLNGSGLGGVLQGGSSAGNADTLVLEKNGVILEFFFKSSGIGGTGWRLSTAPTGADQGNVLIEPGDAIGVRAVSADTAIVDEKFAAGP